MFAQASKSIGKKTERTAGKGVNILFEWGIPAVVGSMGYAMGDVLNLYGRINTFIRKRFAGRGKELPKDLGQRITLYSAIVYALMGALAYVMIGGGIIGKSILAFLLGAALSFYGEGGSP